MSLLSKLNGKNLARFASNRALVFFGLLLGAILVYSPALTGQFLWDDLYLVGENPFYKSPVFLFEVFKHYLYLDSISLYYRPVQNLSYILDYWLWHDNPFGYHLANAVFHGFAGYLLYILLRKILPSFRSNANRMNEPLIAFFVAALWVVHPIHNAAVAYVAGRADSLAAIFAVSGWLLYMEGTTRKLKLAWYGAAAAALLTALCAKEIAFIWIALFAVYLFGFEKKSLMRAKLAACGVMAGILALYLGLRALPMTRPAAQASLSSSFAERGALALRALGDYVSLIFWPGDLHMDRIVHTVNTYKKLSIWQDAIRFEYLSMIGVLAICAVSYMCLSRLPGQRVRVFGALWFLLGFLPISNLFPLNAQVAEHWIYMPSAGLLLFLAGSVCALPENGRVAFTAIAALCLIPLGLRTARRSYDWAEPERFYKQTIAAGGGTPRVHLNLALIYTKRGDDAAAEKILRKALEHYPDYATARINLGICLVKEGKNAEAERYLSFDKQQSATLAKTYPHTWSAALNIAKVRYVSGKAGEALAILEDAIQLHPEIWELIAFKAQILKEEGKLESAVETVRPYATANWWHYDSHLMLGRLELEKGATGDALKTFADASSLDIHNCEALNLIARVNLRIKRPQQAYEAECKAVHRSPDQPSQYLLLATILDELKRGGEAEAALRQAEELANAARASRPVL